MKKYFILLSLCCGLHAWAEETVDSQVLQGLNITEERAKLEQMRQATSAEYAAAKKACYQKLSVSSCLEKARQIKFQKDNEHKRLSLVLNDAERRQRGAKALERVEEKQSTDKQTEAAEQRSERLKQQQDTQQRNVDKNDQQQSKEAESLTKREEHEKHVQEVLDRQKKHQDKLKEAEQSRANYQRKLDEAKQHREQVQKDSASRNPPAAPLPPPASTSP